MKTLHNFSAGPAALPPEVLEEAARAVVSEPTSGLSILCMSHRGGAYDKIHQEVLENVRELLHLPKEFSLFLLPGGATLQFSALPLNLAQGKTPAYGVTGHWSKSAFKEASRLGPAVKVVDTSAAPPPAMPEPGSFTVPADAPYFHLTSNETIEGTRWPQFPQVSVPLAIDLSSDIFTRPLPWDQILMAYAGAQKNAGPAGITLVMVRTEALSRVPEGLPILLDYRTHRDNDSRYNTPATFAVYVLLLMTRWMKALGGVPSLERRAEEKAALLYAALDGSSFYRPTADRRHRSLMNVTFRLAKTELEDLFLKEAEAFGLVGLKGHRAVGGIRASIYNSLPRESVKTLVEFMKEFANKHG